MKFLCLHGASTNAEIFEIQTGGLRQQLAKKGHTFKFINGSIVAPVEGELEGVVDGPFYDHYAREGSPGSTLTEALERTSSLIKSEGPFDAVMGFSQGAALAAALIIEHAKTHPGQPPLFRAAVFLCGATPWEASGLQYVEAGPDTYLINIPTANIVGSQDHIYAESMALYRLCEPSKASFYDHGSRHMIPFDTKKTEDMVSAIEETVKRAMV